MMKKILIPVTALFFTACDTAPKEVKVESNDSHAEHVIVDDNEEIAAAVYSDDSTTIAFGAFKTTEKKEVKGWFTDFSIVGVKQEALAVEDIFAGASIEINVGSLETNDAGRNERLLVHFFSETSSAKKITGKVNAFDKEASIVVLSLDFNGVTKDLDFSYELKGDTLNLNGLLNLTDFEALNALNSLNKACEALHKGDDGVSKTWEDVNIYISTVLNK